LIGLLAFEFEQDLALQDVAEYWAGVAVRAGAGVTRRNGDGRDHGAGVFDYLRMLVQKNVEDIGRRGADRWHAAKILRAVAATEGHSEVEDVGQFGYRLSFCISAIRVI
jgi:hypothetical protein